jgi:hypothetical protein
VFTPLELRAKHRNADADVESDAATVKPTRVAMIKRFMIGHSQCDIRSHSKAKAADCSIDLPITGVRALLVEDASQCDRLRAKAWGVQASTS